MKVYLGLENLHQGLFYIDINGYYLKYRGRKYYKDDLIKLRKSTKKELLKQLIDKVLNDSDFYKYFTTNNDIVYIKI